MTNEYYTVYGCEKNTAAAVFTENNLYSAGGAQSFF